MKNNLKRFPLFYIWGLLVVLVSGCGIFDKKLSSDDSLRPATKTPPTQQMMAPIIEHPSSNGKRFYKKNASGYYTRSPIQCVQYARFISKIPIWGNAHTWWWQAGQKNFNKGITPKPGSVLVMRKTRRLRYGHLAVVRRVIDDRHIEISHSNWGDNYRKRSMIYEVMHAEDISRNNNWSLLRMWNMHINAYGLPYAAHGFIYQPQQLASGI